MCSIFSLNYSVFLYSSIIPSLFPFILFIFHFTYSPFFFLLQTLKDYFHANGNGVALPHLDKHSSLLRSILTLYNKETQELLNLYGAMQEKVKINKRKEKKKEKERKEKRRKYEAMNQHSSLLRSILALYNKETQELLN